MIICEYCQTQLPGHSLFCCQCGRKVRLPDDTLVSNTLGPALTHKHRATTHYAGPGSPHNGKFAHEQHQTYHNGDFNKSAVAAHGIHITWEAGEDEDDAWL